MNDFFSSCENQAALTELLNHLRAVYKEVKSDQGKTLDNIGMIIDFLRRGAVSVTKKECADELLKGCEMASNRVTSATENLFDVSATVKATEEERIRFLSNAARYSTRRNMSARCA